MSFTQSEDEKLIKIVSKNPVLYNPEHADYRDIYLKENTWKEIGKDLNKTSEVCKKRWRLIRDSYNRNKKTRILRAGLRITKGSKFKRHQYLSFLDSVSRSVPSSETNIPIIPLETEEKNEDSNQENDHEQFLSKENSELKKESVEIEESYDEITEVPVENVSKEEVAEKSIEKVQKRCRNDSNKVLKKFKKRNERKKALTKIQKKRQQKCQKSGNSDLNEILGILKKNDGRRQNLLKTKKDDDVELFCRHIAEVLRNLPQVLKAEAKKELSLVVSNYEIMAAKNSSNAGVSRDVSSMPSSSQHITSNYLSYTSPSESESPRSDDSAQHDVNSPSAPEALHYINISNILSPNTLPIKTTNLKMEVSEEEN